MLTIEQQNQLEQPNTMHELNSQQEQHFVDERKEDKIAAARQKLKQFKKKDTKKSTIHQDESGMNSNGTSNQESSKTTADEMVNYNNNNNNNSGRSTPSSVYSNNSFVSKLKAQSPPHQFQLNSHELTSAQFKEQLQLHVQTIGILVAEKAELHSKLQQQSKKCDKKQDECDELTGRLKASRQKISDLEKLIEQMNQAATAAVAATAHADGPSNELKLLGELSSKELLIDEIRLRLNESQEKLNIKEQEITRLNQLTIELKSQLEMTELKTSQLMNQSTETPSVTPRLVVDDRELKASQEANIQLESKLKELAKLNETEKAALKEEFNTSLQRMQKQLENLVDQINRLTDEREESFAKIDKLETLLSNSNDLNKKLNADIQDLNVKLASSQQHSHPLTEGTNNSSSSSSSNKRGDEYLVKIDLLENEIKYFKQQIDLLLREEANTKRLLADKEQSVVNLNKLLSNYEADREKYNSLLEQNHNDKQTISRILTQNNELKSQLTELQDAYVIATNKNLELATQLQSEQFKLKQIDENVHLAAASNVNVSSSQNLSAEWEEDEPTTSEIENNPQDLAQTVADESSSAKPAPNTLIENIKQRLAYLEKENKDLNDYIVLVNKQIEEKDEIINKQLNGSGQSGHENNMKLLEDKFNKVMLENADFREKTQQQEHLIQQLQFETETIVDYISMYQMERTKLNEKYKIKDELIRGLSTQLQVNKLALTEILNYLNAFLKMDETPTDDNLEKEKRAYLLLQMHNLLVNLTSNTSNKLNLISSSFKNEKLAELSKKESLQSQSNIHLQMRNSSSSSNPMSSQIDPLSISRFKNETVLCSYCYGDLFVV